jgi:hypothetical protein
MYHGRQIHVDRQSLTGTGIHKKSTFVVSSGVTLVVDAGGKLGSCRMAGRSSSLFWWLSVLECSPVKAKALEKRNSSSFVVLFFC